MTPAGGGTTIVVELPVEAHPGCWNTAWLTVAVPTEEQLEQELHEPHVLPQSLQPQLGMHDVAHTGRIVTCCAHGLQVEQELHGAHEVHGAQLLAHGEHVEHTGAHEVHATGA